MTILPVTDSVDTTLQPHPHEGHHRVRRRVRKRTRSYRRKLRYAFYIGVGACLLFVWTLYSLNNPKPSRTGSPERPDPAKFFKNLAK
jgi:hypothetical protein